MDWCPSSSKERPGEGLVANAGIKSLEPLRRIEWREQPGRDYAETEERGGVPTQQSRIVTRILPRP